MGLQSHRVQGAGASRRRPRRAAGFRCDVKILTLFNDYRQKGSGEYRVVTATQELLSRKGVAATLIMRTSAGLDRGIRRKVRAFARGTYSRAAYDETCGLLDAHRPDVVHVHNLYPLFSPSVLVACRAAGVRTVMTAHNYRHTCPTSHHYRRGKVCDRCLGGREWRCFAHNCRGSLAESFAYGFRAAVARKLRLFQDNTDVVIVGTRFAAGRLAAAGFGAERIVIMPSLGMPVKPGPRGTGRYVAYAGRMTPEKGVGTLLQAARRLPQLEFRIAGDGPLFDELVSGSPDNVRFVGFLDPPRLARFYADALCLAVPSEWFEMRPMVICEAMAHGIPVVASDIGGLGELVEDGVTGLLARPGDPADLAARIGELVHDDARRRDFGDAARRHVLSHHDGDRCFDELMSVYAKALGSAFPKAAVRLRASG